jgi:hypothetical protein
MFHLPSSKLDGSHMHALSAWLAANARQLMAFKKDASRLMKRLRNKKSDALSAAFVQSSE